MGTTHLPAWQSLGLKLKNQFPQASPALPIDASNAEATSRKRKLSQEEAAETDLPNGIKRRQQSAISNELDASFNRLRDSSTGSESQTLSDSRRKSVTFTADTKAEDGCSSKRLVQAAYASRLAQMDQSTSSAMAKLQNGQSTRTKNASSAYASSVAQMKNGIANSTEEAQNAMAAEEAEQNITNNTDKTATTTHSKDDKPAQPKKLKRPSAQPSSKVEAARQKKKRELAVQYLEQYANSRATWKFNKKRQNIVLQMTLEVDGIPMEHDEAIKSYLTGLQSTGLRQKLRSKAREILVEGSDAADPTGADNPQMSRAKLVLEALGQETTILDHDNQQEARAETNSSMTGAQSKSETTTTNGIQSHPQSNSKTAPEREANVATKKRRRRRVKKRRNVSSSDSDSSSSSEDESESDDN